MQIKPMITSLGLCAVLAVSACTAPSGSGSNAGPRTQKGAAIGAIVGGLFGATRKGDNKAGNAALGAVVGGLLGGGIGAELDRQAADLRKSVRNDQVRIVNTGSELVVTMPQDILFATGSAQLGHSLRSDLGALAQNLQEYPNSMVEIAGHTDNVGTAEFNVDLSRRRAASVAAVLSSQGVPNWRMRTIGYGEDRPVASNLNAAGRQKNRRVEVIIRPTQSS